MGQKGGSGKTTIAVQFLPLALLKASEEKKDIEIKVAFLDNNNDNNFQFDRDSQLKLSHKIKTGKKAFMDHFTDSLDKFSRSHKDNEYLIIDVSGGDDTNNAIKYLFQSVAFYKAIILIPFYLENNFIRGMLNTVKFIREVDSEVKICPIANKISAYMISKSRGENKSLSDVALEVLEDRLKPEDFEYLQKEAMPLLVVKEYKEATANSGNGEVMFNSVIDVIKNSDITYKKEIRELGNAFYGEDAETNENTDSEYKDAKKDLVRKYTYVHVYEDIDYFADELKAIK
ncbi:hypothetical protein [Sulfurimonas paralvinellae]|uniref:ParA family protein n=1 Tax=Sulfurimonas paralvinellae TaxID=317658 RepID=A0A7M1BBJ2_9BACT|nr:hypothetical protein [Sulfurimonas paralvinellae]QOP46806.1 hypothetical protein FM071_10545 [Sulfurimonas paralvinellae]